MVRRLRPIAVVATAILAATTVAVMPGRAAVAGPGGHRDYGKAISHPVHDDTLPGYGGTVVDALHYDLDLAWRPKTRTLVGTEKLRFRAARSTRKAFDLDLASALTVHRARLDGHRVTVSQRHHKLVIHRRVREGTRHTLRLSYRGHPHPVWLATTRQGTMELGWMTRRSGEAWTLQEPYGAFTWYAVNDQPSDKALYDFRIVAPRHWVGVANGRMRSRKVRHQHTITRWRLATPASSYLVTIGIGPYERTVDHSIKGLPISYWTPRSQPWTRKRLRFTPKAVRWLEKRLGRYPFPTLGILVAPTGGMETQTMLTLGRDRYTLSHDVIVHELAHQWFGDEVSPRRWRDVWLNEGWAMYLAEGLWSAHGRRARLDRIFGAWNDDAAWERREEGPPAHPFKSSILDLNVYEIPPLMWDLVRRRVGTARFWRLAAAWPREHRFGSAGYDTAVAWWSARTGISPAWFHRWLLARRQPTDWTPVTGRSTGHDAPSTGSGNTPEHDSVELPM